MSRRTPISPGATWCFTRGGSTRRTGPRRSRTRAAPSPATPTTRRRWRSPDGSSIVLTRSTRQPERDRARDLAQPSCAMRHYYGALVNAFADRPKAVVFTPTALEARPIRPQGVRGASGARHGAVSERRYDEAAACFARGFGDQSRPERNAVLPRHALAWRDDGKRRDPIGAARSNWSPASVSVFSEFGMAQRWRRFSKGGRARAARVTGQDGGGRAGNAAGAG